MTWDVAHGLGQVKKFVIIAANFVLPGTGSLIAGETVRGLLQFLLTLLGILFWMTGSLRLAAVPLILLAWAWAMIMALQYKRRADMDESSPVVIAEQLSLQRQALKQRRGG